MPRRKKARSKSTLAAKKAKKSDAGEDDGIFEITTTGQYFPVSVKSPNSVLDVLQREVDGYVELVPQRQDHTKYHAYVNEEGLQKGMPLNPLGTAVLKKIGLGYHMSDYVVRGPVVIVANKETELLSSTDILDFIHMCGQTERELENPPPPPAPTSEVKQATAVQHLDAVPEESPILFCTICKSICYIDEKRYACHFCHQIYCQCCMFKTGWYSKEKDIACCGMCPKPEDGFTAFESAEPTSVASVYSPRYIVVIVDEATCTIVIPIDRIVLLRQTISEIIGGDPDRAMRMGPPHSKYQAYINEDTVLHSELPRNNIGFEVLSELGLGYNYVVRGKVVIVADTLLEAIGKTELKELFKIIHKVHDKCVPQTVQKKT